MSTEPRFTMQIGGNAVDVSAYFAALYRALSEALGQAFAEAHFTGFASPAAAANELAAHIFALNAALDAQDPAEIASRGVGLAGAAMLCAFQGLVAQSASAVEAAATAAAAAPPAVTPPPVGESAQTDDSDLEALRAAMNDEARAPSGEERAP